MKQLFPACDIIPSLNEGITNKTVMALHKQHQAHPELKKLA
jgi:hypothetical protein